ncbi:hypothetical protein [Nonomuraea typhae]|nr:hypothetical protein [Nonomuraea typhae]
MNIRLIGTPAEVAEVLLSLRDRLTIESVSAPYQSRRDPYSVRVYVEVIA